jgi:hypothetical protein
MTTAIDRTPPTIRHNAAPPPKDVIIVYVARSIDNGSSVLEAAAGNWVVSDTAVTHLTYLVAVTTNNDVVGVFDIVGYQAGVEYTESGKQRVRFDLVPSDRTVIAAIEGSVQGNRRAYAHDLLSGDQPPRSSVAPSLPGTTAASIAGGPPVCPDCQIAHPGPDCW